MTSIYLHSLHRLATSPATISILILSLLCVVSFGKYMENDEGVWNYIGFLWINYGIPPYAGAIENKTPGIFLIFAISHLLFDLNIWFPRILASLALLTTSIILYLIGRKLYDHLAGILAMLLFGLTMAWSSVNAGYAHTESFMVLFSTLAFFFLLTAQGAKSLPLKLAGMFAAGFSIGVAIAFKQVAAFSGAALFGFFLSLDDKQSKSKGILRDSSFLFAGLVFALCLGLIAILLSGITMTHFLKEVWLVLFQEGGGSAPYETARVWNFIKAWRYSEMILFYPLLLLFIAQRKRIGDKKIPFWGILVWITLDFAGANASGHYFGHQFKQIVPSLALASGIAISALLETQSLGETEKRRYIVQAIVVIAILWAPYQALYSFYRVNIEGGLEDKYRRLGLWLKENTEHNDYVYILGNNTNPIQAYSRRRSASRYFNSLFIERRGAKQEIMDDLTEKAPRFIFVDQTVLGKVKLTLPELETILKQSYQHKTTKYNIDIYEREDYANSVKQ